MSAAQPVRRAPDMESIDAGPLRCHAWGHPWDKPPVIAFSWWGYAALLAVFRCPSCGSSRRDVRDRANPAHLLTRLYQHADGYLAGLPADRGDFVVEWFRRYELPPDDVDLDDWRAWKVAA